MVPTLRIKNSVKFPRDSAKAIDNATQDKREARTKKRQMQQRDAHVQAIRSLYRSQEDQD